jgi:hypothetical protein
MNTMLAVLGGTLTSVWLLPAALAQLACVTQNMVVPATRRRRSSSTRPASTFAGALGISGEPVGDQDLFYPNPTIPDGMHYWTLAAALMAKVLATKGYHYQYVFARNSKHVDRPTVAQTLPHALEWLWKGYPIP